MRIHIISNFYPPHRGGIETYVRNLAIGLIRLGHEVKITAAHPPMKPGRYTQDGVAVRRLRSIGRFYGVPMTPTMLCRIVSVEADLIHANFPNPYNAALAAFASQIKKTPAVLTWHNDLPPVTRLAWAFVKMHDELFSKLYLDKYDAIVATSNAYLRGSKILQRQKEKVEIIPNGVDCERFRPGIPAEDLREELKLGRCKTLLFVGALSRWHRYKGLDDLLRAFKILERRDVRLLVVGGGDLRPEYEALARSLNLGGDVIFAGDVPDRILPKYYAASDTLVLPSKNRDEGFGLTILEANASGIPAIASRTGGIPGILTDYENGILVPPNDPTALAEALRRIIENDELRRELGKKAREIALRHDWKRVASETERLYCKVFSTSPE